jgi:NADPH-dependent ferric siderophore reductase
VSETGVGGAGGVQGLILRAMGAVDYRLTVTSPARYLTDRYVRLGFSGGGLLRDRPYHPTMFLRLWFEDRNGRPHQRGYTVIDPDPITDSFAVEFALHEGVACRWALAAQPGDVLGATFLRSGFAVPDPAPAGWLLVGEPASLPAINSLLDALGTQGPPATIWFEWVHDSDKDLPIRLRPHDTLHWVRRGRHRHARGGAGRPGSRAPGIVGALRDAAFDASGHFGWVALDTARTRAIAAILRADYKLSRNEVKAQAYWLETRGPS